MNDQKYPMVSGGPHIRLSDCLVLIRRLKVKLLSSSGNPDDISDNLKDRNFEFDEYPKCENCDSIDTKEVLIARDGNRIVSCQFCGLWFTSPRVNEKRWIDWLLEDSDRNIEFTENRLRYGLALSRNIPLSFSFWWRISRWRHQNRLRKLTMEHGGDVKKIHDVGCGVGFFMKAAEELGIRVSGNDLNRYAVRRMRDIFGFDVHVGMLPELVDIGALHINSYDIVYMNDYIEHTYHPRKDLTTAYHMLRQGGIVYIRTFFVNSKKYEDLGSRWDMLMWNHVFHFTSDSLSELVTKAGFDICSCFLHQEAGIIEIIGRKSNPSQE